MSPFHSHNSLHIVNYAVQPSVLKNSLLCVSPHMTFNLKYIVRAYFWFCVHPCGEMY